MRNLHLRVETLEKSLHAKLDVRQGIPEKAITRWPDKTEQLIRAYGAAQVSRPLTERESAAFRAYTEALESECRWAGIHPIRCNHISDIEEDTIQAAVLHVVAFRVSLEQLELCKSGILADQQGRERNERESAAIEVYISERTRLLQLAGLVP